MKIGINCGHTMEGAGSGAVGLFEESVHTRLVGGLVMKKLTEAGITVTDCTVERAVSQEAYLVEAVRKANLSDVDLFLSIHFNASKEHSAHGVEVYTYEGRKHAEALAVCNHLERMGFINRGIKDGSGLYVIRKTRAKAMLIEVCFCDNDIDVEIYRRAGAEKAAADAVYNALVETVIGKRKQWFDEEKQEFMDLVGKVAVRDWQERRIILPSVVIAQAVKESAWGTSELARKANALFGIKKNEWKGRIYVKDAVEQRPDGSYITVPGTRWRAYDSFEESVIDHNDYIATRSLDGGKTLRYAPIIGCREYVLVCQYLQSCGYATSHGYADSLIRDYIEAHGLTRFDGKCG